MNTKKSFSLVELMVVIAIIGILASIAVPAYKNYIIKAQIAGAIVILSDFRSKIIEAYNTTGSFPASINYGGTTFPKNNAGGINLGNVNWMSYDGPDAAGTAVIVSVGVASLPITGFVQSPNGKYSRMRASAALVNGVFKIGCGYFGPDGSQSVPVQYLPVGCQCDVVKVWNGNYSGCDNT